MMPWAPNLRQPAQGMQPQTTLRMPGAALQWLPAAHLAVCSGLQVAPVHHGDMGDTHTAPCTVVPN